ncbi:MAG: Hsp20 family protein [Tepidibacter sp.]|jgi:HSP20 family molecular chaperone IbpA|uniref:Hsp20/alpha crystallin family protein n=1 Tax=Tepidibacter sp. TaxID=2529387 RepID=UPI0025F532E4|nr:Hsp20 family protein [Tepidibacter sp.]MCT4507189.1 Hsp20 family protein [Tepidibacter sp.]
MNQNFNELRFMPVSTNMSNMGTTVAYSLNPTATVNAMNTNINTGSGIITNHINQGWGGYNQSQFIGHPVVSASHYNQLQNGGFLQGQGIQPQEYIGAHQNYYVRSFVVQPSIDISETASDVVVTACVGDLGINNMNLNATDNSVSISGSAWTGTENLILNRTIPLPTSVRAESIDANLQSGILEIRCPKVEKQVRQRTIMNGEQIQK